MVDTFTPKSFEIVVFKEVFETFIKFGCIMLFTFKSTLLKIIPEFGSDGLRQTFTFLPLCRPIPPNFIGVLIVFYMITCGVGFII